jgi:branched-chain amino acid aminotransferase
MIGTDPALGVGPSRRNLYFVICSPVGPYFNAGFQDIAVVVEEHDVRAVRGGVGAAKTGGNYAAGIPAQRRAKEAGFDQLLWLDAVERRFVEELNAMNVFFVLDGVVVTPPLGGTILPGVTRRSLLELCADFGLAATERPLPIDELVAAIESGRVSEMFAVGTAAVITPIGVLGYRGRRLPIAPGAPRAIARRLYDALTDLQYGRAADPHGWMRVVRAD